MQPLFIVTYWKNSKKPKTPSYFLKTYHLDSLWLQKASEQPLKNKKPGSRKNELVTTPDVQSMHAYHVKILHNNSQVMLSRN